MLQFKRVEKKGNTMNHAATINTRIDSKLKHDAEIILEGVGVSRAEAIRMFYKQICLHNGIPFDVRLPNAKTIDAINELEQGGGSTVHSMAEAWQEIDGA